MADALALAVKKKTQYIFETKNTPKQAGLQSITILEEHIARRFIGALDYLKCGIGPAFVQEALDQKEVEEMDPANIEVMSGPKKEEEHKVIMDDNQKAEDQESSSKSVAKPRRLIRNYYQMMQMNRRRASHLRDDDSIENLIALISKEEKENVWVKTLFQK